MESFVACLANLNIANLFLISKVHWSKSVGFDLAHNIVGGEDVYSSRLIDSLVGHPLKHSSHIVLLMQVP